MKTYVKSAGAWVEAKKVFVRVSGTWTTIKKIYVRVAGVWTQVYTSFTVVGGDQSADSTSTTAPQIAFKTDGTTVGTPSLSSLVHDWGVPSAAGVGTNYWIYFNSAAATGSGTIAGTFNTWLQLTVDRSVSMSVAPPGNVRDKTVPYSIATDAAGATVVATGNLVLSSER